MKKTTKRAAISGPNIKKTADHEAAHAVMAIHEGFTVTSITINPMPGTAAPGVGGVCYCERPDGGPSPAPEILSAAKARLLMAGRVSDELFHEDDPRCGWRQDFRDLAALMPADDETLKMHEFCGKHPGDVERFYQRFKGPVVDLLTSRKGRKAGRALSKALLEGGTLSGQCAASVFYKSWGAPPPSKALPISKHIGITLGGGPQTYSDVLINLRTYLWAMTADAGHLRGELSEKEENRLARVRMYLCLLRQELREENSER
jgi:hypothetical protein